MDIVDFSRRQTDYAKIEPAENVLFGKTARA